MKKSLLKIILYIIIFLVYNRSHKPEENYPEGEALIRKWSIEEAMKKEPEAQPKQSLLDDIPDINIPKLNNGFEGGFTVNIDIDND